MVIVILIVITFVQSATPEKENKGWSARYQIQNPDSIFAAGQKLLEENKRKAAMDSFAKAASLYGADGSFLKQADVLLTAGDAYSSDDPSKAHCFFTKMPGMYLIQPDFSPVSYMPG